MRRLPSLAAGALAAAGALCATLPAAEARPADRTQSCFQLDDVENTRLVSPRELLIRLGDGRVYRMGFGADCNNLGTQPLSLHPFDNSGVICRAIDVNVSVPGVGEQCIPTSLAKLTAAEVAAIPPKDRP